MMMLFLLPEQASANRPLTLEIPSSGVTGRVTLDI
jgi:hypothetical protein